MMKYLALCCVFLATASSFGQGIGDQRGTMRGNGAPASTLCTSVGGNNPATIGQLYVDIASGTQYACTTSGWVIGASSGSALFQTNGANNTVQSKLNMIAGTNITLSPDGAGGVTINSSGGGGGSVSATAPRTATGATDTLTLADFTVTGGYVTETYAGNVAVTAPAPSSLTNGTKVTVKDLAGSGNTVVITPASGTIDGAASFTLLNPGDATLTVDGSNYKVTRGNSVGGATSLITPGALVKTTAPGVVGPAVAGTDYATPANVAAAQTYATIPANETAGTLPASVLVQSASLPLATISAPGVVKPDGTTITISNGVISSTASGGGGGGGSSVGSAGQIQMAGSTAGSFAASHITDNGATIQFSEPVAYGAAGTPSVITTTTQPVSALPSASANAPVTTGSNVTYTYTQVSDGTSATDCTTGGGTVIHYCYSTGSAWVSSAPVSSLPSGTGLVKVAGGSSSLAVSGTDYDAAGAAATVQTNLNTTNSNVASNTSNIATNTSNITTNTASITNLSAHAFTSLTDAAPITWSTANYTVSNATVTLAHTTATRAINLTGLVAGDYGTLIISQDSTGGAYLTGGTGCTWYVHQSAGGWAASTTFFTSAPAANIVNILTFTYAGGNCYASIS